MIFYYFIMTYQLFCSYYFLMSIINMLCLNQINLWNLKTKKLANLSYTVSSIGTSSARYFQFLPPSYRHLYTYKKPIHIRLQLLRISTKTIFCTLMCMRNYKTMQNRTSCTSEQTKKDESALYDNKKTLSTHSVVHE